jgi:uncharacterized protein DUF4440
MQTSADDLVTRLRNLGLECDTVPTDRLTSATAALVCFPMYMVANLHAWTADSQFKVPVLDWHGFEALRESFVIGREEGRLEISPEHRRVLGSLLTSAKPPDLVIYEYALETLKQFLTAAESGVGDQVRSAVARMVVTVAQASGEGLFGTGEKIGPEERACIARIDQELSLRSSPAAAAVLQQVEPGAAPWETPLLPEGRFTPEEAALRNRRQSLLHAINAHDLEAVKSFIAPSFVAVARYRMLFFPGEGTMSYQAMMNHIERAFRLTPDFREEVRIHKVEIEDGTALLTTTLIDYTPFLGFTHRAESPGIETWQKIDGQWMFVKEERYYGSRLPEQAGAGQSN